MQLCSKEMQGVTSILPLQELHAHNNHTQQTQQQHLIPNSHLQPPPASQFDSPNSHDVFLDQVLGSFQASWSEGQKQLCNGSLMTNSQSQPDGSSLYADGLGHHGNLYDETTLLASRLRQHQISPSLPAPDTKPLSLQQQILMQRAGLGRPVSPAAGGSPLGFHELPLGQNSGGENKVESLCKGPTPSRCLPRAAYTSTNQQQHFQQFQAGMNDAPAGGAAAGAPKQKVRARRGQATDPHSIAERLRRERIAERMKALQELVPIANKPDKATMLDEIIEYVKFLRLQVKVLSMSRIGYPAAVTPLLADIPPSEAASGLTQQTASTNESMTGTEDKVAKLMEEDVGSAMQYLQGKGLCLMPISLASVISPSGAAYSSGRLLASAGDSPSSPSMSVLSVQSVVANGGADT